MNKNTFFQNKTCEFFPCHSGISIDDFNCMFCYCPLYMLGSECGGNYRILPEGIKDCSDCTICHQKDSYKLIEAKFSLISQRERQNRK